MSDDLDTILWSQEPEILRKLLELDARGYSQTDMVDEVFSEFGLRTTRDRLKNGLAFARLEAKNLADVPPPDYMPNFNRFVDPNTGELMAVAKNSALLEGIMQRTKRKIAVFSDIHVPFTDEEKLQKAVELNRAADILIIAGDVLDMYGCSRHRKQTDLPHTQELDMGMRLMAYLAETFPVVIVLPGNHDRRALKKIQDLLPPELFYLFTGEPVETLTRPFPNVFYHDNWYLQVGDAIFTHAEISSIIEGRPAVKVAEWFLLKGWKQRLGLDDIRVVVQAHTHQVNCVYREGLKMIECGCLAKPMEYTMDSRAVMRPPLNGCVSIIQYNGQSDFNQTREYLL